MSTLTSADLSLKRPSTRVHAAPGGGSQISFSDGAMTPVKTAPKVTAHGPAAPTPTVAAESPAAAISSPAKDSVPATVFTCVSKETVKNCRIGVIIGGQFSNEALQGAILSALHKAGFSNIVLRMVKEPIVVPYVAKALVSEKCDAVFAGCVLNAEHADSLQLNSTLQHALVEVGVQGTVPVIPGVVVLNSALEAKVVLPSRAAEWADAIADLVQLAEDPKSFNQTVVFPEEAAKPVPAVISENTSSVSELMDILRESLKAHGVTGIFSIGRKFRIVDDNNNGSIEFSEFKKCMSEHALGWTESQIKLVFDKFDSDKSGSISYDEFLRGVRSGMNDRRKQLVLSAFQILDSDKSGVIEVNDIEGKYNASKHPDVIAGKRSPSEILREFLDTFDSAEKDGKVTPDEFCEYYANVSSSIDDDDYFELMIRNAWHMSGGVGWCENTSCRRVLVTHTDGHQTVEEIKNDLGIGADDKEAMIANLVSQGIATVASIDLKGSVDATSPAANPGAAPAEVKSPARVAAPAEAPGTRTGRYGRGGPHKLGSSITF